MNREHLPYYQRKHTLKITCTELGLTNTKPAEWYAYDGIDINELGLAPNDFMYCEPCEDPEWITAYFVVNDKWIKNGYLEGYTDDMYEIL
jgi:hypothetical protein